MEDLPPLLLVVFPIVGVVALVVFFVVLPRLGDQPGTLDLPPEGLRGRKLASWAPGGRLGPLNYSIGLLWVAQYESGLVVRPLIGRGQWIAREKILSMAYDRDGTLRKGSIIRTRAGQVMLWTSTQQHAKLVDWWKPEDQDAP